VDNLLWSLVIYLVYTLPLFLIAWKSEHPLSWLAFVPLANLWLMCDMTDLSLAYAFLIFIPFVGGLIFQAIVWWNLSENTNKPGWLGLLMVIPFINLIVGYYIALVEPETTY
jgi:hypothetical protein